MCGLCHGFAGYGIYSLNTAMKHNSQEQEQSSPAVVGGSSAGTPAVPQQGIDLQDVPRAAASVSADGQMATEEIVEKVAPREWAAELSFVRMAILSPMPM